MNVLSSFFVFFIISKNPVPFPCILLWHSILTVIINEINMEDPIIQLSHKEFLKVDKNYEKAAAAVKLVYVKDADPGIQRIKNGKGFTYIYDSKPLKKERLNLRE